MRKDSSKNNIEKINSGACFQKNPKKVENKFDNRKNPINIYKVNIKILSVRLFIVRKVINIGNQIKFGQVDIADIEIDPRCRDEITQMLLGLKYIYSNSEIRLKVFSILEKKVPKKDINNGRPGMDLWQIFVLAVLRVNCNSDWDKIQNLANEHMGIRQMMGLGTWFDSTKFPLQTIKDNAALLNVETVNMINVVAVNAGHGLVKKDEEELRGRCDSFVVETDVSYPTDINMLLKAMNKVIFLLAALCVLVDVVGWRKYVDNFKKIKKLFRKCQKLRHSTSKDDKKKGKQEKLILEAYQAYLQIAREFLSRARGTLEKISAMGDNYIFQVAEIEHYMAHALRQIDQIERRCANGEKIPHDEKVFSIFEEHTEWISKGKAGVPVELGLRVCILEGQYGFILHHRVMEKEVDVDVAVPMVKDALENFSELNGCSYDKGFWSPDNRKKLDELLDHLVLPKKGKLSANDKEREYSDEFIYYRHRHSAVESGINALENHGLDRCLDHGIDGFKRYVALAVLGRNLQKVGAVLQAKELKKLKRKKSADSGGLKKVA